MKGLFCGRNGGAAFPQRFVRHPTTTQILLADRVRKRERMQGLRNKHGYLLG